MNDDLPKGWVEITLRDAGVWGSGGTPSRRRQEFFGKGIPWVKSGDLPDGPILKTAEEITNLGLQNSSAKLMPAGTISMALYGATIGKLGMMTFPAATNQACANVIPDKRSVESRYLFYYLLSERRNFIEQGQGGAQPNISQEIVCSNPFRLAPVAEQRRIVAKLETLLSTIEACQKRLDLFATTLKRFRQAVLSSACSGRLTADWRKENPRVEPAPDFVRRVQQERRVAYESRCAQSVRSGQPKPRRPKNEFIAFIDEEADWVPEHWCVTRIGDISDCLDHLRVPVNKDHRLLRQGLIPYYGANGQVGTIDDYLFDEDLVLVVEDETFIGREKPFSYVVRGKSWVNNHAHVLRALGGMPVEFLNIALSYYAFTPLTSGTTGRRKLTQEALIGAPLAIPSLPEQLEIVRRVQASFELANRLEARYLKAKAYVDKLTQSTLARAFRGGLVPTEAELAEVENRSFESASELIERIRNHQRPGKPNPVRVVHVKPEDEGPESQHVGSRAETGNRRRIP
jgi:type I restriction enzyme S subunit